LLQTFNLTHRIDCRRAVIERQLGIHARLLETEIKRSPRKNVALRQSSDSLRVKERSISRHTAVVPHPRRSSRAWSGHILPLFAAAALVAAGSASALTLSQAQTLLSADAEAGDNLGYSIAIDGDTAIVGAYYDDDRGADAGAA